MVRLAKKKQRFHAMSELTGFQRRSGERTDQLLTRFDSVRMRAVQQGQMNMSIQGLTWILLRAIGMSENDFINLLQPLQGQMPSTAQEYRELLLRIRRMAHIREGTPNNIASAIRTRGGERNQEYHAQAGLYMLNQQPSLGWQAPQGSNADAGWPTSVPVGVSAQS